MPLLPIAFLQDLGAPELLIIVLFGGFIIWPYWRIFRKIGHPGWLGILMIVPFVNFALFLFLAFSKWPLEQRLEELEGRETDRSL